MNDRLTRPAAEVAAFFREVARDGVVWTLRDRGGMPAPLRPDHRRVQPFWSSRLRAVRLAAAAEGFAGFEATMIPWHEFRDAWLPGLERDALLVGVNWCGANAIGYDLEPSAVRERIERVRMAKERATAGRPRQSVGRQAERGAKRRQSSVAPPTERTMDQHPHEASG